MKIETFYQQVSGKLKLCIKSFMKPLFGNPWCDIDLDGFAATI